MSRIKICKHDEMIRFGRFLSTAPLIWVDAAERANKSKENSWRNEDEKQKFGTDCNLSQIYQVKLP